MIKTYNECIQQFGNQYQIDKALSNKQIFKLEEGIYSDMENVPEVAIISAKYSNAIISGEYAFYFYGLTDVIPEKYTMATKANASKIVDPRIFQIYDSNSIFGLGLTIETINNDKIKIYDKERMLIELLRNKNKIPHDMYKEILLKYRNIIYTLDFQRIQEYAESFPKSKMIQRALEQEVL